MKRFCLPVLTAFLLLCGCDKEVIPDTLPQDPPDTGDNEGFEELVPERPDYVDATLVYYGGDGYESADYWILNLYTEMEFDGDTPVGPGQMLSIALNVPVNGAGEPSLNYLAGEYRMPSNSMDFSEGTYVQGEIDVIDMPGGEDLEVPTGSYFADIPEGETSFVPDLIREGSLTIKDNGDGTFTAEGILVGTQYLKRYFSYTGEFDPENNAGGSIEPEVPNTNLTEDIVLTGLTQSRLIDNGDYFVTGTDDYRHFLLYLAEEGVDLSQGWPSGTGRLLHLELLVPGDADPADGIPAGVYTMANRISGSYMPRENIVPFRIVEGLANVFEYNSGTWYQELKDGDWLFWGRITGGTVTVERDGAAHFISFALTDCGDPSHTVSGDITIYINH